MMEIALRAKKAEIYTVETLENNFYLLDDLKPDLIIFDLETCQAAGAEAMEQLYGYSKQAKLLATTSEGSEKSLDSRVNSHLSKPIVAHSLAERLLSLID